MASPQIASQPSASPPPPYWKRVFRRTWDGFSVWAVYRGLAGSIVALIAQLVLGLKPSHEIGLMAGITFGTAIVVFATEFLIRVVRAPFELDRIAQQEIEGLQQGRETEKAIVEQNRIQREHLDFLRESKQQEQDRERRDSMPFFLWAGGGTSGNWSKRCEFRNAGGPITKLEVFTDADIQIYISPSEMIQTDESGKVEFQSHSGTPESFSFQIAFKTKLGERVTKHFRMTPKQFSPEEIE